MEAFEIYDTLKMCASPNIRIYRPTNDAPWNTLDVYTLLLGYLVQFKNIIVIQTNFDLAQMMCKSTYNWFSQTGIQNSCTYRSNYRLEYTAVGLHGSISFYGAPTFQVDWLRGQTIDVAFLY